MDTEARDLATAARSQAAYRPLEYYGGRPGYDCDAAFARAMSDPEAGLIIRPSASPYYISSPIQWLISKELKGLRGATIQARSGFSGSAMLAGDYGYSGGSSTPILDGVTIDGDFTLQAAGYARRTIYMPWVKRAVIKGSLRCLGATAGADGTAAASVEFGPDPAVTPTAATVAHDIQGHLEIRAAGTRTYNASSLTRGFWARSTCTDSLFRFVESVGYNVGLDNDGAHNFYHHAHPWTDGRYQAMKYGMRTSVPVQVHDLYADTPCDLGDTAVGDVYGLYADSLEVSVYNFQGFLNATVTSSTDIATGVYLNKTGNHDGAWATLLGGYLSASSNARRWKYDLNGNSFNDARNGIAVLGWKDDGNVLNRQASNLINNLNLTARPIFQGTGTTSNDGISFNGQAVTKASVVALSASSFPRRAYIVSDPAAGKFPFVMSNGTNWLYADGTTVT